MSGPPRDGRATSYGSLNVELIVPPARAVGDRGERGQDRERVRPPDDVQVIDLAVLLAEPEPFGEEQEVELGALSGLGEPTKEPNSMWLPAAGSLHTVVLLTPGKWAARWDPLAGFAHRRSPFSPTSSSSI